MSSTTVEPKLHRPIATEPSSWSMSLEQWAQQHLGGHRAVARTLPFAPRHAPRPYQYHDLPVAALVVTSSSSGLHDPLLGAVRLLQESTYRFRLVLVTDDPAAPALSDVEWPVEHIMAEEDWHQMSTANWLPGAADQLRWVHHQFGASVLYAPSTPTQVTAAVRDLAMRCDAHQRVARAAIELTGAQQQDDGAYMRGLRGWWQQISHGEASFSVLAGGEHLTITANRGPRPGVLISPPGSPDHQAALHVAREAGWSAASIQSKASTLPAAVLARAIRAARDGLAGTGPVLLIGNGGPSCTHGPEFTDGVIHMPAPESAYTLRMNYGASLDFRSEELPEILEGISQVHRVGTCK